MTRRVVFGLLIVELLLGAGVQAQDACATSVPANVRAGVLERDISTLLLASPTFRAQCERIAAATYLRVDIQIVQMFGGVRAETTITRYRTGFVRANVKVGFGQDYPELIAHEFEHVIEQLDGVDLRAEAEHGGAWLVDTRVFETRRAAEAGWRVRRECEASWAHTALVSHEPSR